MLRTVYSLGGAVVSKPSIDRFLLPPIEEAGALPKSEILKDDFLSLNDLDRLML